MVDYYCANVAYYGKASQNVKFFGGFKKASDSYPTIGSFDSISYGVDADFSGIFCNSQVLYTNLFVFFLRKLPDFLYL